MCFISRKTPLFIAYCCPMELLREPPMRFTKILFCYGCLIQQSIKVKKGGENRTVFKFNGLRSVLLR